MILFLLRGLLILTATIAFLLEYADINDIGLFDVDGVVVAATIIITIVAALSFEWVVMYFIK